MTTVQHRPSAIARLLVAVAMTVAILLTSGVVGATPASAWTRLEPSGRPGKVALSPPMAIDSYDGYVMYLNWRTAKGPLVYRSPANRRAQNVAGIYTLQEWTPSFGWTNITRQVTNVHRIRRGHSWVRLPALDLAPNTQRGYFRVAFTIAWSTAATGKGLGYVSILPNRATDHQCITRYRPCQAGVGWMRTGRLFSHGGGW